MIRHKVILYLVLIGMTLGFGCSDRGTNVPPRSSVENGNIDPSRNSPIGNPALNFQVFNPEGIIQMSVYGPIDAFQGNGQPRPLLILLAPENENKFYYSDHGIVELAEDLIATGQIEPMIIAMVGNDEIFGGYYYANSFPGGNYDDVIGPPIMRQLKDFLIFPIIDAPNKRAIGGFGQGAYGAFRSAIVNPGYYGAVMTGDGPLDFDGSDGNSGLISIFDEAIMEQGLSVGDPNLFSVFDSSSFRPISQSFIGGSMAFSPHDTNITVGVILFDSAAAAQGNGDTLMFADSLLQDTLLVDIEYFIYSARDSIGTIITDSSTLISSVLNLDLSRNSWDFDFHLPFDADATPNATIWPLWMANNLDQLLTQNPGALSTTNCWIGTTTEGTFGPWQTYGEQTRSWIQTLTTQSVNINSTSYTGYGGNPATRDEYVYDLMREMLLFVDSSTFKK